MKSPTNAPEPLAYHRTLYPLLDVLRGRAAE
jgi:hypothetical protein